jgi:hypothetical protein
VPASRAGLTNIRDEQKTRYRGGGSPIPKLLAPRGHR